MFPESTFTSLLSIYKTDPYIFDDNETLKNLISKAVNQHYGEVTGLINPYEDKEILEELMEAISMPIYNEKTKEYDTVDLTLVPKIILESFWMIDIATQDTFSMKLHFTAEADAEEVFLHAEIKDREIYHKHILSLKAFEQILFDALNKTKDQRIESVEEYKSIIESISDILCEAALEKGLYLMNTQDSSGSSNGLGVIQDTVTGVDIGVFDELVINTNSSTVQSAVAKGVMLSGKNISDIASSDRYTIIYYDFYLQRAFSFESSKSLKVVVEEDLTVVSPVISVQSFDEFSPELIEILKKTEGTKEELSKYTSDQPQYDDAYKVYRSTRLEIIELSKERQKQEKLINQFSDIEIW